MSNRIRRIGQLLHYSRVHARQICSEHYAGKEYLRLWIDVLSCYYKYGMWSNQYLSEKMYALSSEDRKMVGEKYLKKNQDREAWLKSFIENRRFLIKYSGFEMEASFKKRNERSRAYRERYHAGKGLGVESGVLLTNHHYMSGNLVIKENVMFARDVDIDYTGDLTIGMGVSLAEGAKVLTHTHDLRRKMQKDGVRYDENDIYHATIVTPLVIDDFVWVGTRAVIMPGVTEIGRGAVISANTVVTQKVPPYAIVQGNPARVVGYRFSPKAAAAKEMELYPSEERIPLEVLKANYNQFVKKKV